MYLLTTLQLLTKSSYLKKYGFVKDLALENQKPLTEEHFFRILTLVTNFSKWSFSSDEKYDSHELHIASASRAS